MALPAHSRLSASASSRWTVCPGSVPLSIGAEDRSSYAALEGTALHAVMEKCLIEHLDAADVPSITITDRGEQITFELDDEQHEAVQFVLDHARSLVADNGTLMTETKVLYGSAIGQPDNEAFGTVDVAIVNGKHLHILDAKFGRRYVDPEENTQMLLYGIGMLDTVELLEGPMERVTMHISQPRLRATEPEPGWEVPREDFNRWQEFFREAAAKVASASAEPITDEWQAKYLHPSDEGCYFCRAAAHCPALRKVYDNMVEAAKDAADPDDFDVIVTDKLPRNDLGAVLAQAPLVKRFLEAVEDQAFIDLRDGKAVTGFKLVVGRQGNRKWRDENEVLQVFADLGDDLYQPAKVRTPTQLAKALRDAKNITKKEAEDAVNELVVRDPAKPSIVPETQPGTPWSAEVDFEIVK